MPLELEAVVCQMMARDPNDRYPTPLAVIAALNAVPGADGPSPDSGVRRPTGDGGRRPIACWRAGFSGRRRALPADRSHRVLVVSPRSALPLGLPRRAGAAGLACVEAATGDEVRDAAKRFPADVVLIDGRLPDEPGLEVCRRLRAEAGMVPHQDRSC